MSNIDVLSQIRDHVRTRFEASKRVLSFEEYFEFIGQNPYQGLRNSAHYLLDTLNYFGTEEKTRRSKSIKRYKLFDLNFSESRAPLVGQEDIQGRLFQILTGFTRTGKTNKLIVFHGPNGSAKSTFVRCFFEALEHYSGTDEGRIFHFSWIFPHDSFDKANLGIGARRDASDLSEASYAKLEQNKIGAIVRSELHENPIFLIPKEERSKLFEGWLKQSTTAAAKEKLESLRDYFLKGELSHKNALIFEALLSDYAGDYKKLLRHIRVERLYFSNKFRKCLVTVEPQFGVDANIRQVTLDRSMANLPAALHALNLFQLEGDLIDGNRGAIEYNDFLKRPLEHFKYLLSTCETASVNLSHVVAFLDTVFMATTDERHLESFREHAEYPSFKSRLEFIKVPYLLRFSEEESIYSETAVATAGKKELMPHTVKVLALWAVLSRLKRPILKGKNSTLTRILENLSPLAKAKLYDSGELPEKLNDEERRELKNHVEDLLDEQQSQPYYEGLLGPSARELKQVIQMAGQNEQYPTLGPHSIFAELRKMVKRPMDFEYLRLEPNQGYHAFEDLIEVARLEWLNWVDREMRLVLEMQNDQQFFDHLNRYMQNIIHYVKGEKMKNRHTGEAENPSQDFMQEFEQFIGVSGEIDEYRKNLITRIGAWSLENTQRDKSKVLPFDSIFPDLMEKLRNRHHEQQVNKIKAMGELMIDVHSLSAEKQGNGLSEAGEMALKAYRGLQERFGYGPLGAKEALIDLIKSRYV